MRGNLIVVSAPSGGGKTSLVRAVLAAETGVELSISFTTRAPRPGEKDGREYHFARPDVFEAMLERGEFLECAEVHGNRYGTSQRWIEETIATGKDVLLEIDWQGARQVRRVYPSAATVFILPPSMAELERRLRARGQDSEAVIRRRLENAADEISHAVEFDYVIINNTFEEARRDLAAVLRAARLSLDYQVAHNPKLLDIVGKL
ncbi:MAG: guanylate kinase [Betaproteobacteria bacterium RIFCSPLOWO2_12_FULL_63_13]|nr:MAG: guanylate kinase [Betaproteobacteria bacterium RIFCSPLOWO2_02_FULL_63_19]OGA51319.1 MAG: guanylate kinase [Betaproteobacteria bacterium RIFCSPLOWO2_12_FULL_63_13]